MPKKTTTVGILSREDSAKLARAMMDVATSLDLVEDVWDMVKLTDETRALSAYLQRAQESLRHAHKCIATALTEYGA